MLKEQRHRLRDPERDHKDLHKPDSLAETEERNDLDHVLLV